MESSQLKDNFLNGLPEHPENDALAAFELGCSTMTPSLALDSRQAAHYNIFSELNMDIDIEQFSIENFDYDICASASTQPSVNTALSLTSEDNSGGDKHNLSTLSTNLLYPVPGAGQTSSEELRKSSVVSEHSQNISC